MLGIFKSRASYGKNNSLNSGDTYEGSAIGQPEDETMNNQESLEFIRKYFDELFGKRNIDALDVYLDQDYSDDDIGDPNVDHLKNSKEYLRKLFREKPTIGVDVKDAVTQDGVISAFLEWFVRENNVKRTIRKGVAIFVIKNQKIRKRHTYIYDQA
jgi:hypothetical protein